MSKIKEKDLNNIAGGQEPEEFEWQTKGYVTPVKEQDEKEWVFRAIGNLKDVINKIFNK